MANGSNRTAANAIPVFLAPAPGTTVKNYSANTAGNQIKTGPGVVYGISVNTAGTGNSITLYDGTSTGGRNLGTWSLNAQGAVSFPGGGIPFTDGLFAVVAGGTPANANVSYS